MKNTYRFNKPIKTLLRNFENKKSGKVVESRREIRRRFDFLDRSHQVKFLMLCFFSCKSDRDWAFEEVTRHWDPQFKDVVANLWYKYQEETAALCIVKHFPLDFVLQEYQSLDFNSTYYDLCLRIGTYYSLTINTSRLTPVQALSLFLKTKHETNEYDVLAELYRLLYSLACDDTAIFEDIDRDSRPNSRNFGQCKKAFYFIMELQQYWVLGKWKEWDGRVQNSLCDTVEYRMLKNSAISDYDYRVQISDLYRKHLLKCLDKLSEFKYIKIEVREKYLDEGQLNEDSYNGEPFEEEDTYNDYWDLKEDDKIPF